METEIPEGLAQSLRHRFDEEGGVDLKIPERAESVDVVDFGQGSVQTVAVRVAEVGLG